jgi:hypothetical protein
VECKRRQSGGEYIIGLRFCALEYMGHSATFEPCIHRAQHLQHLRCIWTACIPSLVSRVRLERADAIPCVSDVLGACRRHPLHLGRAWSVQTPSLASQTCLERADAVPGVSDALGSYRRRPWRLGRAWIVQTPSWRLGRAWTVQTPFPASHTRLECLHAISGSSDASVMLAHHL